MKKKLILYYRKLSLIQKLSIPLILSLLFGIVLTSMIIKQVSVIDKNTVLLKDDLIPMLEKSTNNQALLKNISENLTFATLAGEEDMLSEISENMSIKKNLNEMYLNKNITLTNVVVCQKSFEKYFTVAMKFVLSIIHDNELSDDIIAMNTLLKNYNDVQKKFLRLNREIEEEIEKKTELIEKTSQEVIYFTVLYLLIFSIILFYLSYIIYKDFNKRINSLSKSLDALGVKKSLLENDDTIAVLSKNIEQTVMDYSIIEAQRKELFMVNRSINESIEYASFIQEAILPSTDVLHMYLNDYFVSWKPRDTVGGDIYFISELKSKNEIIVMLIDGVGHGISGGFLTILVKAIETQIIAKINSGALAPSPAKILEYFNQEIKSMLKQDRNSKSNMGFDGGVLYYNKLTNECRYAGAKTPLYIIRKNQLEIIKSDRRNVGFVRTKIDQKYTEYNIQIEKGTKLYITSDGMIDQEGLENTRYGKERFENLILSNNQEVFEEQKRQVEQSLDDFKGERKQSDDISIIGMEF